jgi:hypothetical protein
MVEELCRDIMACDEAKCMSDKVREFEFTLKVRVDCHRDLRRSAVERLNGMSEEDIAELLGPIEDPTLRDCLITLLLPQPVMGCTLLSVDIA